MDARSSQDSVQIAGILRQPHGAWMKEIARNLTDNVDGFLSGTRYHLIHDRGPPFTDELRELLRSAGGKCLKLPAHSPNLNAFAERFVLSVKCECLNKLVLLGERHSASPSPSSSITATSNAIIIRPRPRRPCRP